MSRSVRVALGAMLSLAVLAAPAGATPDEVIEVRSSSTAAEPAGEAAPNVVCDAGFESGGFSGCWTRYGGAYLNEAYEGMYGAEFCTASEADSCRAWIQQTIEVPNDVAEGTIGGWVKGDTTDDVADCSSFVGVYLAEPANPLVVLSENGAFECDSSMDDAWTYYENDVTAFLQEHEGEEILLWVGGEIAGDGVTPTGSLYVDNVFLSIVPNVTRYDRSLGLSFKHHLKAKGVASLDGTGPGGCFKKVKVNIQKKVGRDEWKKIDSAITTRTGSYNKAIPDKSGKYRAVAPAFSLSDIKLCRKAVSETKKHQH